MKSWPLAIFLGLLLSGSPALAQPVEPPFEKAAQALQAREAGDLELCAQLWAESARLFHQKGDPNGAGRAWFYAAVALLELEDREGALPKLEQARGCFEAAQNASGLALVTLQEGSVLYQLGRQDSAEVRLRQAVEQSRKANDPSRTLEAMEGLRKALEAQLRWTEATGVALELLELQRQTDPEQVPDTLVNLGALQQVQNRYDQAGKYYREAIAGLTAQQQHDRVPDVRARLAQLLRHTGQHQAALDQYRLLRLNPTSAEQSRSWLLGELECLLALERLSEVLELTAGSDTPGSPELTVFRAKALLRLGKPREALALIEAPSFGNDFQRGQAYVELEQPEQAEAAFRRALESAAPEKRFSHLNDLARRLMLWNRVPEAAALLQSALDEPSRLTRYQKSVLLVNLGEALLKQGQSQQAVPYFQDGLEGLAEEGSPVERATALNNLGAAYTYLGRYPEALSTLLEADRTLASAQSAHGLHGTINNALGNVYLKIGQVDTAADSFRRALATHTSFRNPEGQISSLLNLGSCAESSDDPEQARSAYRRAQELAIESGYPALAATAANNLGAVAETGPEALAYYREAQELNPHNELFSAIVKGNMAVATMQQLGRMSEGRKLAGESLDLFFELGALDNEVHLLKAFLESELREGDWNDVSPVAERLLERFETLVTGLPSRLARSLLERHQSALRGAIGLAVRHDVDRAFAWEELTRSLGLAAMTAEIRSGSAHLPPQLVQRQQSLLESIRTAVASPPSRQTQQLITDLYREHRLLLDQIEGHHLAAGRLHPQKAAKLPEVQESLAPNEALVMYLEAGDLVHLILVRPDSTLHRTVGSSEQVDQAASRLLSFFKRPQETGGLDQATAELAEFVWGPLDGELDGVESVVVVPTGRLFSLPFAGLSYRGRPLLERYTISTAPSASAWLVARQSQSRGQGALLGALGNFAPQGLLEDGAASDEGRRFGSLPLPGTLSEVSAISAMFPTPQTLKEEALRSASLASESEGKQVLHFATHGILDSREPLFSGLVAADGMVTAADIYGWKLSADLAVLSACHSGERADGEEYVSLSSAFTFAGTKTLLVSMWAIDDEATSEWMQLFYRELHRGKTAQQALQHANLTLRQSRPHPFHWAPFTLWGDGEVRLSGPG